MSVWLTVLLYLGILLLIGALVWAIGRISRKRGEAEVGSKILGKQEEAAADWRRGLRNRPRLRGRELRKRLRELARKG